MTTYPGTLDSFREIENLPGIEYDVDNKKTLYAEDMRATNDAILAIEQTVGTNPQGAYPSVAYRLDVVDETTGDLTSDISSLPVNVLQLVYPIGSIYINSSDDTNPADLFGFGTWDPWSVGRAIVGLDSGDDDFDTPGQTGGSATTDISHTHGPGNLTARIYIQSAGRVQHQYATAPTGWVQSGTRSSTGTPGSDPTTQTGGTIVDGTTSSGGSTAINNLMPYQVGYVWERVG